MIRKITTNDATSVNILLLDLVSNTWKNNQIHHMPSQQTPYTLEENAGYTGHTVLNRSMVPESIPLEASISFPLIMKHNPHGIINTKRNNTEK